MASGAIIFFERCKSFLISVGIGSMIRWLGHIVIYELVLHIEGDGCKIFISKSEPRHLDSGKQMLRRFNIIIEPFDAHFAGYFAEIGCDISAFSVDCMAADAAC